MYKALAACLATEAAIDIVSVSAITQSRAVVKIASKLTFAVQFYILFKSAHHLDFKHTVFGRVVGGEHDPYAPRILHLYSTKQSLLSSDTGDLSLKI